MIHNIVDTDLRRHSHFHLGGNMSVSDMTMSVSICFDENRTAICFIATLSCAVGYVY